MPCNAMPCPIRIFVMVCPKKLLAPPEMIEGSQLFLRYMLILFEVTDLTRSLSAKVGFLLNIITWSPTRQSCQSPFSTFMDDISIFAAWIFLLGWISFLCMVRTFFFDLFCWSTSINFPCLVESQLAREKPGGYQQHRRSAQTPQWRFSAGRDHQTHTKDHDISYFLCRWK